MMIYVISNIKIKEVIIIKKIIVLFSFLICLLFIVSCVHKEINLMQYDYVRYNNQDIDYNTIKKLNNMLNKQKKTAHTFYEYPDMLLECYKGNEKTYISIYIKEGYLFKGYFLKAFTERMEDKKTKCYKLDNATIKILEEIKVKYDVK